MLNTLILTKLTPNSEPPKNITQYITLCQKTHYCGKQEFMLHSEATVTECVTQVSDVFAIFFSGHSCSQASQRG